MGGKFTHVVCGNISCRTVLEVPEGLNGNTVEWIRELGWSTLSNALNGALCQYCRRDHKRVPRPPKGPTAEDVAYAERMAQRQAREEAFKAEVFAQHHAAKPDQPMVRKALARKSLAYYGQTNFGRQK